MKISAENQQPNDEKQPKDKQGISNRNLGEEQKPQGKVLPFRERTDKKEIDHKTK